MNKILTLIITLCCLLTFNSKAISQENNPENNTLSLYLKEIQKKINLNWKPAESFNTKNILAFFKINRSGEVLEVNLLKPAKDPAINESAIEAIKASAPFGAFPESYKDETLGIEFEFNYKVWNSYNFKTISLCEYLKALESRLFMNWDIAGLNKNLTSTVSFNINIDGTIDNANLISSSGSNKFDNAALTAIQNTSPFYTLPVTVETRTLRITATFDNTNTPQITLAQFGEQGISPIANQVSLSSIVSLVNKKPLNGEIVTPSGDRLPLKLINKNNEVLVYINNRAFKPSNTELIGDKVKFAILMTPEEKSKILFKGKVLETQVKGIALDSSGKEGYWFIK